MTPRRSSTIAIGDGDGQWFLGNAGPDLDAALRGCTPLWPRPGDAVAPIHGDFLTDAELDHTVGLLSLRQASELHVYGTAAVRTLLSRKTPPSSRTARCQRSAGGGCHESLTTTAARTVTAAARAG